MEYKASCYCALTKKEYSFVVKLMCLNLKELHKRALY